MASRRETPQGHDPGLEDELDTRKEGIPLTERTRDEALQLSKQFLDKLADAQKKQSDTKSNRDAKPGDSSAQSDYDRSTENICDAEKALEQFNTKYGKFERLELGSVVTMAAGGVAEKAFDQIVSSWSARA